MGGEKIMIALQFATFYISLYILAFKILNFPNVKTTLKLNISIFIFLTLLDIIRQFHFGYQRITNFDILGLLLIFISFLIKVNGIKNKKMWIATVILIYSIYFILNISMRFIFNILNINIDKMQHYGIYTIYAGTSALVLTFIIYLYGKLFKMRIDYQAIGKVETILIVLFLFVYGFFISAINSAVPNFENRFIREILTFLAMFSGVLALHIILYLLSQKNVIKTMKQKEDNDIRLYEEQQKYFLAEIKQYEAIQKFKHNIYDELLFLQTLFTKEINIKADKYIQDMLNSVSNTDDLKIYNTGVLETNVSWYACIQEYENENICTDWLGKMPENNFNSRDMVLLFSNILRNAFEATIKCSQNKFVKVIIDKTEFGISILVENSYNELNFNSNNELITTKKDSKDHGFGTKIIKQIVEKYSGELKINKKDNVFSLLIYFPL